MDALSEAVLNDAGADELARLPVPEEYAAAHLRAEDAGMFGGVEDKDVRKSLRVGPVPTPELAPDEVLVAVLASSVNYNTVWSATFEPASTFSFLQRYGRLGRWERRHDQPYHVLGSDAAGVIVRVGSGVRRWNMGDRVLVSPIQVDDQEAVTHHDGMLGVGQYAWGYETNFGGLAHYAVVRASQLIRKPAHLTWEEAASTPACGGTAYRMLVGEHGARMKQGDVVLIWGATGGLGAYAVQLVRNGGGIAVGVVGSERKTEAARRLGCHVVINRQEIDVGDDLSGNPSGVIEAGKRLGKIIRREVGDDPNIVFEYVGKATFGISLYVTRTGGVVVTCGSSTGYQHEYDNRYLWMKLKRIIGSHAANLHEEWETNRLVERGQLVPALSTTFPLADIGEAARLVQANNHIGKIGVLGLAPERGLGVSDPETRQRFAEGALTPLKGA